MFEHVDTYCMFVGYPRSGHSLVGSLLNAHPDLLICHELDALALLRDGAPREAIFSRIQAEDARFAASERQDVFGYDYAVPGAWQGRIRDLKVIGDKKGGRSTWWLHDEPWLLDELRETLQLPIRFIHVHRSPWDNIATISTRGHTLDAAISWYRGMCAAIEGIKQRIPTEELFDLSHEAFIADPTSHLYALCDFLGVERNVEWAQACSKVVNKSPHQSRFKVEWSEAQKALVAREMAKYPWFDAEVLGFGSSESGSSKSGSSKSGSSKSGSSE